MGESQLLDSRRAILLDATYVLSCKSVQAGAMEDPPGLSSTDSTVAAAYLAAANRLAPAGDGDDDGDGKKPPENYSDLAEFDIQTNKTEERRLLHGSTTGFS